MRISAFPLYVTLPGSAGIAVMSTFLPDLEPWQRGLGFSVGAALFAWAVIAAFWHVWRPEWRLRIPFGASGTLYVGNVVVFDNQLDREHWLSIGIRAHNGTAFRRKLAGVNGFIHVGFTTNGTGQGGFDLAAPILETDTAWVHAGGEIGVSLKQFFTPDEVKQYRDFQAAGATPSLMFGSLDVLTTSRWSKSQRLPLWDGVSLQGGLVGGRIVCVTAHASGRGSASLGKK